MTEIKLEFSLMSYEKHEFIICLRILDGNSMSTLLHQVILRCLCRNTLKISGLYNDTEIHLHIYISFYFCLRFLSYYFSFLSLLLKCF